MNAPQKIQFECTITSPDLAVKELSEALLSKLEVIAGKRLPDGVHRIDGTDILYALTESTTHHDAAKAVAKLEKVPGHSPWELATPHEAVLLVDYSRYNPAIDTDKHPGIGSEWCWLKDVYKSSPSDFAWLVNFSGGYVYYGDRGSRDRALAVCRPAPASQQ
ncbi:DUF1566 domain-containing protein [Dyella sp.]|uniref:Lcl C-terminal domain-containing protein n=1 Tax=Dyella sp. TaxID=1869338 RepID=UPI00283D6BF0|nr:DUF1566 domain-containing protein [Dyella sp.]MDR3445946.1 DUF1566 domain-containing protein [Dyella sp.]